MEWRRSIIWPTSRLPRAGRCRQRAQMFDAWQRHQSDALEPAGVVWAADNLRTTRNDL
jgi:hypothetical protein